MPWCIRIRTRHRIRSPTSLTTDTLRLVALWVALVPLPEAAGPSHRSVRIPVSNGPAGITETRRGLAVAGRRSDRRNVYRSGVSSPPALSALDALDRLGPTLTGSCRPATRSLMSRVLPGWVELQDGDQAEHDAGGDHCGVRVHIVHTRTGCRRRESSSAPLGLVVGPAQNGKNSRATTVGRRVVEQSDMCAGPVQVDNV